RQAVELAALGQQAEKLYGTPMDVEWARRDGAFVILQARPITALGRRHEEWNDSLKGDYLWTAGNLGEAIPDVMTPVTWSFVRLFIAEAMSASTIPGFDLVGNIGGRFYMNLSIAFSVARAFGLRSRRSALEQVFGRVPAGLDVPMLDASRWELLRRVLPVAVQVRRRVRRNLRGMRAFLAASPQRAGELRARIAAISDPAELAGLAERAILPYLVTACRTLGAAGGQGGATLVLTRVRLTKMAGETDAEAMLTGANADGELASLGLLVGLGRVAAGQLSREEFARRHGHRGPHEFELSAPRPGEDPAWLDAQLAGLRELPDDPETLLERQREAAEAAWDRFARRHPRRVAG